jgi:5-methylcytosine-specific restriction endonuclease McrA
MESNSARTALYCSVLVLNRYYLAVHVVNVRRAFGLLYRQLAEVLDIEEGQYANYDFETWLEMSELRAEVSSAHDDWIRSVSFEILVPRVIRLLTYDRVPNRSTRFNRRNLFARDNNQCQYCGRVLPASQLSIDHVLPRSRSGATTWDNVVACCLKCNTKKGGRTPQEAHMKLLNPPREPRHNPMFVEKLSNPKYATWKTFVGRGKSADIA